MTSPTGPKEVTVPKMAERHKDAIERLAGRAYLKRQTANLVQPIGEVAANIASQVSGESVIVPRSELEDAKFSLETLMLYESSQTVAGTIHSLTRWLTSSEAEQ